MDRQEREDDRTYLSSVFKNTVWKVFLHFSHDTAIFHISNYPLIAFLLHTARLIRVIIKDDNLVVRVH